jgi:3-methyladenine DNA glycosylase/8-oxoguanine DNA glycosylase
MGIGAVWQRRAMYIDCRGVQLNAPTEPGTPRQMRLTQARQIDLRPTAPFHFDGTVHKPSYFPTPDSAWQTGTYWWTLRLGDACYGLKLHDVGSLDAPRVTLTLFSDHEPGPDEVVAVTDQVADDFALYADLSEFNALLASDELMRPVLQRWRGTRVSGGPLYEMLVICIVLQNAVVRRSIQMMQNLLRAYGTLLHFDGQSLYAYWPPAALDAAPEEDLRALKAGYRAKALKRISLPFARCEMNQQHLRSLPNAELERELHKLYGIGVQSVWYVMFGVFHRYDAFEYVSPWEQKIYSRLLFDQPLVPGEEILAEVEQRWGRWKMLAANYLFEDLFWRNEHEPVPWLAELIRR